MDPDDSENMPCGDDIRGKLAQFHEKLMYKVSLKALQEPEDSVNILLFIKLFIDQWIRYEMSNAVVHIYNFLGG